ncbi:MAG: DUF1538 family protein [Merdibacter sp.]
MASGYPASRGSKEGSDDSFGLVALCSIGPIIMVLLLGIFTIRPTLSITPLSSPIFSILVTRCGSSSSSCRNIPKKCSSASCRSWPSLSFSSSSPALTADISFCA